MKINICNILFILIYLFQTNNFSDVSLYLPNSIQLSDLSNVVVASDGIHFYNQDMSIEYTDLRKNFTLDHSNLEKVSISQFPNKYLGYILILVNNEIYIYDKDKNFIKYQDISDIINGNHYSLIPYKKNNNNLIFYISYFESNAPPIIIVKFTFDLSSIDPNIIFDKKSIQVYSDQQTVTNQASGLSCLFLSPLSSLNIANDLLTCFSAVGHPPALSSITLNPEDNLNEIQDYRHFQFDTYFTYNQHVIYAMTNINKKYVMIYIEHNFFPFWAIYDYTNGFSSIYKETVGGKEIANTYSKNKMFYFEQTKEFVVVAGFKDEGCDKFVMVFKNFRLNYKGILHFPDHSNGCENTKSFTAFHNGHNYTVLSDDGQQASWSKLVNDIELIGLDNYLSDIISEEDNEKSDVSIIISTTHLETPTTYLEPPTTITTTYLEPPTTITTTYLEPPTTITTTYLEPPTTIITTYLETLTTITTTYLETPTTIFTTYLEPQTTITTTYLDFTYNITNTYLESSKTIISTYLEDSTTIPSTIIESKLNYLDNIKCKTSSAESALYNLCTSCNIEQNYFPAYFLDNTFLHGFKECYNENTKPINFYFDNSTQNYKPCYETCLTCKIGGNFKNNNCLTCDVNYRKKPGNLNTSNCVTECFYYFYYSNYGQYKCTNSSNCPQEAKLLIKDLKKCTNNCKNEEKYKYQYGGQCIENCPKDTLANENNICIDKNLNSCTKSENEIDLYDFLSSGGVDFNAKNYAKEFEYTTKHVSYYYNSLYSILFYKDIKCIEELSINMIKIDFGDCYSKIKENLDPPTDDNIIIGLIEKKNADKKSTISSFFYHPLTGEKLDADILCKDEEIIVKENILSVLNETDIDLDSILYLTQQDINIFNSSDKFYTDICYSFDSPNGKDVPLKDRIKTYYPNITLCNTGCNSKGVNLTTMESICECKFNDIINNDLIERNAIFQNTIGEITDIISSSNILVLKCFKNVFKKEYFLKGHGAFIIMSIAIIQIIFAFIFTLYDMRIIRKYLFNLTEYFMLYINKNRNNTISSSGNTKLKAPPKRHRKTNSKIEKSFGKKKRKKLRRKSLKKNSYEEYSKSLNNLKSESKIISSGKSPIIKHYTNFINKENPLEIYVNQKVDTETLLKAKNICGVDMEEYLKRDIDEMEYDDAIKLDKRTFCEFFDKKLKEKQIIMNTFYYNEKLRPKSIKIILFLLNIDLYFVINGLFFNEEYISQLFNSNEKETFFSFLSRSISRFFYSILVGFIVGTIIDCIFIEEKKVRRIFIREKEEPLQLKYEIYQTVKSIKNRYVIFIFLCIFISMISWYYISCFNNTYPGVKSEWIKSSIVIIIIMQFLSLLIVLLQSILRSLSFYYKSEKLYKVKQLIS